ncbi:MAG: T9SS type A sorting domain-containing protein, partial [Ignavibacteriae bacterium]|nr:T9SS type A sorting domain-containing protein [Ignavibacteriota bacterium]
GTPVTFTATPTNGGTSPSYRWKKNGSNVGTNSAMYSDNALANNDVVSCVMTSDATCASPTTATSNSITMTVNPTITPSVSISADPSGAILPGTPVTFTATPTNGGTSPSYQWKKNGSNVGTNSAMYSDNTLANGDVISCVMTSNAPCASPGTATSNTITAMLKYTLTVQATNGSVTKDPDQSSYNSGTQVQLTATPATGYHFVNWSGDLAGSENPDTLIMDGNKTVTANFAINTYTLTASAVGNGTITPSGNVAVQYGSSQSFTTSSDEGYHLDSIVVDGVRTDSLVSYTFYNVTGVHSITAYFSINYYALTTQVTGGGAITRTPPGDTYARGTEVTLVSTSNAHFNFSGWSGDTTGVVIRNDTLIVTMDVAKTIRANFAIVTYTITVTQGTNGTISPGTTTVDYGSNQTFTITPDSNYEIDRVPVDGNDVGKVTIYTFSNVTANRTLTAQFRPGTPLSSITVLVPNGNEIWRVGQTYTMSWSKVKVASVKVEYTIDSGRTWNVITSSTAATDTSWTIPDLPSGVTLRSARVRISSVTNSAVNDESDAQFIIQNLIQPSTSGTTRSLRDVAFSGQTGYVVGDSGTILKTTNGGQTWSTPKNTNLPANVNWKAIYLFDASICLVLGSQGNNAVLYSTFNGARSWSHENTINQIKANDIARAGGIGYIIVGDSGKISALATPTSAPPNVHLFGITSAGDSVFRCGRYWCANPVLYVVGANGTILRLKWTSQLLLSQLSSGVTTNLKSVSFININTGWVVGDSGTILKTTNGGTNWTQQASPTTVNLNGISMSSATSGWVVGDNGTILKYTPPTSKAKWRAGVQSDESVWTQVESGTTNDLTVASVTDNGSFVTVGDSGTALTSQAKTLILSSPTGGGNYIAGQSLPITWSSDGVEFVKIEYSADSGQTWLSVTEVVSASAGSYNWTTPGTTAPYVVVAITDVEDSTVNDASDSTFALVSDVAMFRTFKADTLLSKKGVTLKFDKLKNLTSGKGNIRTAAEHVFRRLRSMKGATFLGKAQTDKTLKKKLGWIALSTANQLGKMFTAPHTGTSYPIDSVRSPAPRKSKKLFGALKPTRKAYNNPAWEQGIIFRLNLIASSMGITPPGFGDLVLDTTSVLNGKQLQGMTLSDVGGWMDSVMTWWDTLDYDNSEDYAELAQFTSLLRNINEAFYDSITFSNSYIDSTAVIKGDSNLSAKILKPMNPFAMYLRGVITASQSSGLLKYVLGSESRSVAIQPTFDEETEIPYEYELYQNYPNPFNPSTVIRYSLPVNGLVTLKVYNMLGQEVATILNNEEMESGEYELPFNATNFASGVYFYRINVESVDEDGMKQAFTDVKRMLMMK